MIAILPAEQASPWTDRPFKWRGDEDRESFLRSDHITIRLPDGMLVWRGFFFDRLAAVEFWRLLHEGRIPADYWSSPSTRWCPGLEEVPGLVYEFATQVQIISTSAQPWRVPNGVTTISRGDMFGCGGSGANATTNGNAGAAGGSGAYGFFTNYSVTPVSTITWAAPAAGGAAVTTFVAAATFKVDFGRAAANITGGAAGATANCVGVTATAGVVGGAGNATSLYPGAPGVGAPGPQGAGAAAGILQPTNNAGGSGGGGGNGGTAGSQAPAVAAGAGAVGGDGKAASGHGTAGTAGGGGLPGAGGAATAGSGGGGGGGGSSTVNNGGNGGVGADDLANTGFSTNGPGGGGGCAGTSTNGSNSSPSGASGTGAGGAGSSGGQAGNIGKVNGGRALINLTFTVVPGNPRYRRVPTHVRMHHAFQPVGRGPWRECPDSLRALANSVRDPRIRDPYNGAHQ